MDTKINKAALHEWATNIYTYNDEAINSLNELKNTVNSLSNSYECASTESLIESFIADVDSAIKTHTDMESLQTFLEKVVENAENV